MNPKLKFIKNQSGLTGNMNVAPTFNPSLLNPPTRNNSLSGLRLPPTTSVRNTGLNQGNKPVVGQSAITSNPATYNSGTSVSFSATVKMLESP